MPIDDSTFKAKFEAKLESYTGDHVKTQLQTAYTNGVNDLFDELADRFIEEKMFTAIAVLNEFKIK